MRREPKYCDTICNSTEAHTTSIRLTVSYGWMELKDLSDLIRLLEGRRVDTGLWDDETQKLHAR